MPGPPAELTGFVGRDVELSLISAALADARLVTLAGPGGCGKTRLAAKVAGRLADRWPDGTCWVDLTATGDPAVVAELVAGAAGVLLGSDQDQTPSLGRQLADRRMLVCLDNCEHVVSAAADVVAEILRGCPEATVLATSREPLDVPGELVWRVPPLTNQDSVALFTARASQVADTAEAAAAVRAACHRLEGMPLAVELAAAWSGTLSPQEILTGLDDRFRLLIRGPRGVAARHQTLAASMAWSHDLLDGADRRLFRRLGVFRNGFTAAPAHDVCTGHGDEGGAASVIDGLRRLIEKSLLVADTGHAATRYRMLETVREYAITRLEASGEIDAVRRRHLEVYGSLAASVRPLVDSDKDAWRTAIGADYENLHAAVEWGLEHDPGPARHLAADLPWFWHFTRRGNEGLELLGRAIDSGAKERTGRPPVPRDAVAARDRMGKPDVHRTGRCRVRDRGPEQPGHRPADVHQPGDGEDPPVTCVRQARRFQPHPARPLREDNEAHRIAGRSLLPMDGPGVSMEGSPEPLAIVDQGRGAAAELATARR